MINQTIQWASEAMRGQLLQDPGEASFEGVSTDTRDQKKGELFFCLMGIRNGHEFASNAVEKGAAGVIIDQAHLSLKNTFSKSLPLIVVPDTLKALGDLAHAWRKLFSLPVIALTGSNGKTTTKEFIRIILSTRYQVLATEGNFNNLIGVPKTLFRLSPQNEIAVVEMGMNDFGEIHRLSEITEPTVGLITNVAPAHLEKLRDVPGVARAKGELFAQLSQEAIAVVNLLDPQIALLSTAAQKVLVGTPESGLWGEVLQIDRTDTHPLRLKIHAENKEFEIALKVPGPHNLENVLLALAVGRHFKISWEKAKKALESFQGAPSRMELVELKQGRHLLDDCYNANPISTAAALKTLAQLKRGKKALAILGDMKELGDFTPKGHQWVGRETAKQGIEFLVAVGAHSDQILEGARAEGMKDLQLQSFPSVEKASQNLDWFPPEARWILVKGSRSSHLEKLANTIKERF